MNNWIWPWDWDWHWQYFALYAGSCFFFGLLTYLLGVAGIIPIVIGAIVGACAGNWEWFEK